MIIVNESFDSSGVHLEFSTPQAICERNLVGVDSLNRPIKFSCDYRIYSRTTMPSDGPRVKVFRHDSRHPDWGVIIDAGTGLVKDTVIYKNGYKFTRQDKYVEDTIKVLINLCREENVAVFEGRMLDVDAYKLIDLYAHHLDEIDHKVIVFLANTAKSGQGLEFMQGRIDEAKRSIYEKYTVS